MRNVDKAPLTESDVRARAKQFAHVRAALRSSDDACVCAARAPADCVCGGDSVLLLTHAPRFVEKAALLRGVPVDFVVGYDTAVRLCDPKYYDSTAHMTAALLRMADARVRMVVAGRSATTFKGAADASAFLTLHDMAHRVPECVKDMFVDLPADDFRLDVSSSALRAAAAAAAAADAAESAGAEGARRH